MAADIFNKFLDSRERGVSLYLTIVVITILSAAVLALAGIITTQLGIVFTIGDSVSAFFAADAGIETALKDRESPQPSYTGWLDLNNNGIQEQNYDSFFTVSAVPKGGSCAADNFCIVSQGRFRKIWRAIKVEY